MCDRKRLIAEKITRVKIKKEDKSDDKIKGEVAKMKDMLESVVMLSVKI